MRLPIVHVRILIFAISIACSTIDTFAFVSIYAYLNYGFSTKDDLNDLRIIIFSLINDALSLLIGGYYLIRLEYMWNNPPKIVDYAVCGIELALWIIYAGLQSKFLDFANVLLAISFIYVDKLTPLGRTNNNSGVETNNSVIEVREHN
ncbi:uncharacterized protein OCT59_002299 [Rhizophagus irregularis]|uniref:uncharacterized protein n=1 Tax=Rhizophagus irregularis TaxID=588596 RepID=UPI000CB7273A|nr:hypothetical protein OCT59_002299 [Rhizophagus irregularis]GBC47044.1 hypothetical protein GLOIN_2v1761388 [Rhizophagus irregularis DAOM 181602=DAOM 197198]